MRFASLGSGSKGNATLVEYNQTCLMIDCGFSVKETTRRLQGLSRVPEDISAILVTHEHSDHWKGVMALASQYSIPVYLTAGCLRAVGLAPKSYQGINLIDSHSSFKLGELEILPIPVPHDASEPVQYIFSSIEHKLGLLTDTGSITPYIKSAYRDCDGLIIEANHDLDLLAAGDYPRFLKQRVAGLQGHLNNTQTAELIAHVDQQRVQHIVIAHISQANNNLKLVQEQLSAVYSGRGKIHYACQNTGFDWLQIGSQN